MPWTKRDYPDSMKNLSPRVRNKAIEIANALLDDYEEGRAIAIATSQAKEWAERHPDHGGPEDDSDRVNLHVVPDGDGWAVKREGEDDPEMTLSTKDEAVQQAKELASDRNASAIIHRRDGTVETSHNYA
ncbi:DUF2188 domain-containing protein [Paenibacillus sp. 1P07SE]|uniref:DUF2188 domain-containing protein n=1 Tax=Paenibacillus sp. 1P07SE TaxID=3132209 RepID=UPI0039A53536